MGLVGAQPLDGAGLDHPQQLDLQLQRHGFDFIEKHGAAVGMFQLADALAAGARERALLVAEQFGFDDFRRQGPAIERHEWCSPARPLVVQGAGDNLLARPSLAEDQDIRIGRLPARTRCDAIAPWRRATDQPAFQTGPVGQFLAQLAVFQNQPALVQGPFDHRGQARDGERLFHEIIGAGAHGLHRKRHVAVTGDQHHGQCRIDLECARMT
jgi:hypothetical protein